MIYLKIFRKKIVDILLSFLSLIKTINKDYADVLLVASTCAGLFFIYREFRELKKQNYFTEKSIRQTSRPLLRYTISRDDSLDINIVVMPDSSGEYFAFKLFRDIENLGNGPLFFAGYIQYNSPCIDINIRKELLEQKLNDSILEFDKLFAPARLLPLYPNESNNINTIFVDISKTEYFFYYIFFYKDIDGNLYDTIHLENIVYSQKYFLKEKPYIIIPNDNYHQYTREEQLSLYNYLINRHKGLAEAISFN